MWPRQATRPSSTSPSQPRQRAPASARHAARSAARAARAARARWRRRWWTRWRGCAARVPSAGRTAATVPCAACCGRTATATCWGACHLLTLALTLTLTLTQTLTLTPSPTLTLTRCECGSWVHLTCEKLSVGTAAQWEQLAYACPKCRCAAPGEGLTLPTRHAPARGDGATYCGAAQCMPHRPPTPD